MIPIKLQASLKLRAENFFEHALFKNPKPEPGMEMVSLQVFEQNLPQKSKEESSFFPFLIIKLLEGERKTSEGPHLVNVGFIIGAFDADSDNQGYRDVAAIINKLYENLSKYPIADGQFELEHPIKWRIHEEETDPYFFGVIETTWTMPILTRVDVEELI